jgi:hypothetical protein
VKQYVCTCWVLWFFLQILQSFSASDFRRTFIRFIQGTLQYRNNLMQLSQQLSRPAQISMSIPRSKLPITSSSILGLPLMAPMGPAGLLLTLLLPTAGVEVRLLLGVPLAGVPSLEMSLASPNKSAPRPEAAASALFASAAALAFLAFASAMASSRAF